MPCNLTGGLIDPSEKFIALIRQWEVFFVSMHGDTISHEERVLDNLRDPIEAEFPHIPEPIIERYVKFRTFTRYVGAFLH